MGAQEYRTQKHRFPWLVNEGTESLNLVYLVPRPGSKHSPRWEWEPRSRSQVPGWRLTAGMVVLGSREGGKDSE